MSGTQLSLTVLLPSCSSIAASSRQARTNSHQPRASAGNGAASNSVARLLELCKDGLAKGSFNEKAAGIGDAWEAEVARLLADEAVQRELLSWQVRLLQALVCVAACLVACVGHCAALGAGILSASCLTLLECHLLLGIGGA